MICGSSSSARGEWPRRGAAAQRATLASKLWASESPHERPQSLPRPARLACAEPGSADRVLTFRNLHNWAADADAVVQAVFKSAIDSLKPGGVLGVVDHRLPADRVQDARASSGYVPVAYVTRLAQAAGFKLLRASEINANPRDSADHAGAVWALPPSDANKDQDRARFEAIGESDRSTLRLVKPWPAGRRCRQLGASRWRSRRARSGPTPTISGDTLGHL